MVVKSFRVIYRLKKPFYTPPATPTQMSFTGVAKAQGPLPAYRNLASLHTQGWLYTENS